MKIYGYGYEQNGRYCPGYLLSMECYEGFSFLDGRTQKTASCVEVDDHRAEWRVLDSCYPRNYLNFNIIKSFT